MPTWITARRLGATAVLYAVFVGGWYLGQPLAGVGCDSPEPAYVAEGPNRIVEPGEISDGITSTVRQVATITVIDTASVVDCGPTPRPRLMAWVVGDWR
ncbi:hypothetical protein [Streptomyces sp. NPDC006645]|uniref:hypothetical protein n=1 Tax=unclassified Streptomyces TaxID=2593676 RepID=UPI0033B7891F